MTKDRMTNDTRQHYSQAQEERSSKRGCMRFSFFRISEFGLLLAALSLCRSGSAFGDSDFGFCHDFVFAKA